MLKLFIQLLGWLVAHSPRFLLRLICRVLGRIVLFIPKRRYLIYSNLHHAFPEKPRSWHDHIARTSSERLVETGLLSLATPFLSRARLLKMITPGPGLAEAMELHKREPAAVMFCSPHIAYWEILTAMPLVVPPPFPEFGVIYRPLNNSALDAWVKRTRERFGLKLLSRREGFGEAMKILRRQGCLGLLFDQNAGDQGSLTTLLGRTCSSSELSGLLAAKFKARVYGLYARRLGFWKIEMNADLLPHDDAPASTVLALNHWLETKLSTDDSLCASWLWSHDRWRNRLDAPRRLRLAHYKNSLLDADLAARGHTPLPRRHRLWIYLPPAPIPLAQTVSFLPSIRAARPDAEITLFLPAALQPHLPATPAAADFLHLLPETASTQNTFFAARAAQFPDTFLVLDPSPAAARAAAASGCRYRIGLVAAGARPSPDLTAHIASPGSSDTPLGQTLCTYFGLA